MSRAHHKGDENGMLEVWDAAEVGVFGWYHESVK
jgi:hypothetical protein